MKGARSQSGASSPRGGPSLKARALRWLAQREHSRVELRRKLMPHAVQAALGSKSELASASASTSAAVPGAMPTASAGLSADPDAAATQVDAVLDWLEANRYLSSDRFIESRVQARQQRFGSLRIAHELKQHRLGLPAETAAALRASELERARALHRRRYPECPADAAERARRARFLAGRGFAPDVITRVLREGAMRASDDLDADAGPGDLSRT